MNTLKKLNIGIIGLGHWGPNIVRNLSNNNRCCIRYVCDLKEENFRSLENLIPADSKKTISADELIRSPEVDAVVIATSASTHYPLVKKSLQQGKHVFCEKPLTLDNKTDQELSDLAKRLNLKLMVGYTFLFNSSIRKLKELVDNNRMGSLYYLTAVRTHLGLVREDVSVVWDLAPHDVAIMNYLLDSVPEKVSAVGSYPLNQDKPDVAFINLLYPNDVLGQIHVSWVDSNKDRMIKVIGDKARAVFNDLDGLEPVRIFEKGISLDTKVEPGYGDFKLLLRDGDISSPKIEQREPLKMILDSFIEVILDNAENLVDGVFAQNVASTIIATHKSIKKFGSPERVEF